MALDFQPTCMGGCDLPQLAGRILLRALARWDRLRYITFCAQVGFTCAGNSTMRIGDVARCDLPSIALVQLTEDTPWCASWPQQGTCQPVKAGGPSEPPEP